MDKVLSFQKIVPLTYLLNNEDLRLFSLEQLHEYNMNNIGDKENGAGFDKKYILTLKDLNDNELHFRLYSFILSVVYTKHIKKELFKRLIKYPEQLDYYIQTNNEHIGIRSPVSYPQKYFLEEYLTREEERFSDSVVSMFFNKSDMNILRDNLKACIPIYAHINNYSKNTTFKKLIHKINKTEGLNTFLNHYADLFYDYRHNDLKPKWIQLKLIRQLFCVRTVDQPQKAGSLSIGKYKEKIQKYTRKGAKMLKRLL